MLDKFSPDRRHVLMASIKSKNSKAERTVFSYLTHRGIYFKRHYIGAIGKPDIALPRKKKACFIDGDFWHGRRLEELVNKRGIEDYWTQKILKNIERDKRQRSELIEKGWDVMSVWETDINRLRTRQSQLEEIERFLLG